MTFIIRIDFGPELALTMARQHAGGIWPNYTPATTTIQTVPEPPRPVGGPPLPLLVLLALSWRRKWAAFVAPLKV